MLELESVSLSAGGQSILQDLSFTVIPGEMVAILGVSGAGKSSVFQLLIGEKRATQGSVKLDDYALETLSPSSVQKYRRQIGIVFQDFRLLPKKTVFGNIAFALEACGEEHWISDRVPELLRLTGLEDRRDAFPHQLSGGEKQRTAIARALVHRPKILIADEATGNLDPRSSREIARLFKKLNEEEGLTILFSTHDFVFLSETLPRVIRLEDGKILFDRPQCSLEEAFEGIV